MPENSEKCLAIVLCVLKTKNLTLVVILIYTYIYETRSGKVIKLVRGSLDNIL